ncbi:hypothetical protein EDB86DRAFT_2972449, partial [Lactarius hatsudake]
SRMLSLRGLAVHQNIVRGVPTLAHENRPVLHQQPNTGKRPSAPHVTQLGEAIEHIAFNASREQMGRTPGSGGRCSRDGVCAELCEREPNCHLYALGAPEDTCCVFDFLKHLVTLATNCSLRSAADWSCPVFLGRERNLSGEYYLERRSQTLHENA